jgi:hypothetical protein
MEYLWLAFASFLPSLVVAGTAYMILKSFFEREGRIRQMEWRQKSGKDTLALKLQAYERLTLLCERCDLLPLLMRMQTPEMSSNELHAALIIGITQEFDHNVTQQIYISDTLWKLISSARSESIDLISAAHKSMGENASREQYIDSLFQYLGQMGGASPFQRALGGIRLEAGSVING